MYVVSVSQSASGWSGRAPAPPAIEAARGAKDEGTSCLSSNARVAVVGIDIGKNSFHIVGQDGRGEIVLRQKWSRCQVEARFANMSACLIGMEACVGATLSRTRLSSPKALEGNSATASERSSGFADIPLIAAAV